MKPWAAKGGLPHFGFHLIVPLVFVPLMRSVCSAKTESTIVPGAYTAMIDLVLIDGFEWDEDNARKNEKHGVTASEMEQVFFNQPLLMLEDAKHSQAEPRFLALGMTHTARKLHITFTVRGTKIRAISARDVHRKERTIHERAP